jgi:hypothetical protein
LSEARVPLLLVKLMALLWTLRAEDAVVLLRVVVRPARSKVPLAFCQLVVWASTANEPVPLLLVKLTVLLCTRRAKGAVVLLRVIEEPDLALPDDVVLAPATPQFPDATLHEVLAVCSSLQQATTVVHRSGNQGRLRGARVSALRVHSSGPTRYACGGAPLRPHVARMRAAEQLG